MSPTDGVVRRPRAIAIAAIAVLAGCGLQDPYPIPGGPGRRRVHPAAVGEPVTEVVMFIEPRPGPRVVLLSAEPIGQLDGASVEFYSSPAIVDGEDVVIGEQLRSWGARSSRDPRTRRPTSSEHRCHRGRADRRPSPDATCISAVRLTYRISGAGARGRGDRRRRDRLRRGSGTHRLRVTVNSIATGGRSGWGGRIRTFGLLIQSQAPYRLATPQWTSQIRVRAAPDADCIPG